MTKTQIKKLIKEEGVIGYGSKRFFQILLRHGKLFLGQVDIRQNRIAMQWKSRYRPKPKRCFYNSQKFAKENSLEMGISYWEGVICSTDILYVHAWNTVGSDLIDLTLVDDDLVYFGVRIDTGFLYDHEAERWDNPPHPGGPYMPEYFKDNRYKDYLIPGKNA